MMAAAKCDDRAKFLILDIKAAGAATAQGWSETWTAEACGTPVIAFNRGSVPEIIEDGLTGFIVEDETSAVGAVRRLPQLSRAAIRKRFEERFTARRMAQDYLDVYRSQIRNAVPRPRLVSP